LAIIDRECIVWLDFPRGVSAMEDGNKVSKRLDANRVVFAVIVALAIAIFIQALLLYLF
jgi:hypothetical protein